jgi:hypothetical protein
VTVIVDVPASFRDHGAMTDCKVCTENDATEAGDDPWAVARLETGYVRLNPNQYFAGAVPTR